MSGMMSFDPGGSGSNLILMMLAAVGGVALVGVAAMALMHVGGMSCCG